MKTRCVASFGTSLLLCVGLGSATAIAGNAPLKVTGRSHTPLGASPTTPPGSTRYIHIEGQIQSEDSSKLLDDLTVFFCNDLDQHKDQVVYMYVSQTDGSGHFFLNLIAEPTGPSAQGYFNSYLAQREAAGFRGLPVNFKPVRDIFEQVDIQTGVFKPDSSNEDGGTFEQSGDYARAFAMTTVAEWMKFTDTVGDAFLSKQSANFLGYMRSFVNDPVTFQDIESGVLAKSNEVIADLSPFIILDDNTVIDPQGGGSPFFDIPFVRACWAKDYENGNCYKP